MTLGKETFNLNKGEFSSKIGRIIQNFRCNSRLIGEPREFILRCCRLTAQWGKLASDPEVVVYLRNLEIANGRKIKMISLERGTTRQPVSKSKLVDFLYPPRKISTAASPEEKHFNAVKVSMRNGVNYQLKEFRDSCTLPCICYLSGRKIRQGDRTDVDHTGVTFSELCDTFLSEKGLKYTDISLKGPPTGKVFSDTVLWAEWIEFHQDRARFALTLASANRSKGCGDYTTPEDILGSFSKEDPEDISLEF